MTTTLLLFVRALHLDMKMMMRLMLVGTTVGAFTTTPQLTRTATVRAGAAESRCDEDATSEDRRRVLQTVAIGSLGLQSSSVSALEIKSWEKVELPVSTTLFDIEFETPDHGYLVGSKGTFLETVDGGKSWKPRTFANLDEEEEVGYRFEKVSFSGPEGFVIGKPPILLHTKDSGKSWERIPLSPKLPGEPSGIQALGGGKAEMTTSTGAIYSTSNAGLNWKALVKETIDATLNRVSSSGVSGASYFTGQVAAIDRDSKTGSYLAVSSRGNFYLTWQEGQDFWIPHNRNTNKRIQSMGFVQDDATKGLWMTLNGGSLTVADDADVDLSADTPNFKVANLNSGGYGILDVAWKDANEVWAVGGGGTMYVSKDQGKTFKFDRSADNIPGNLYNVRFFGPNTGETLSTSDFFYLTFRIQVSCSDPTASSSSTARRTGVKEKKPEGTFLLYRELLSTIVFSSIANAGAAADCRYSNTQQRLFLLGRRSSQLSLAFSRV